MANIFEIGQQYQEIMDELEENGGELTEEIQERLNINRNEMNDKLDAYRKVIKMKDADIATAKEEIEELSRKIKVRENIIKRLKDTISFAVNKYGGLTKGGSRTFSNGLNKFTFVKTTPVVIDPDADVSLNNKELLPYLKTTFVVNVIGEDAIKAKKTIDDIAFGNPLITVKQDSEVRKNDIKPVLEIKEVTGVHIDKEAGYIKIS